MFQERRHRNLGAGASDGNAAYEGTSAKSGRAGALELMSKSCETCGCRRGYLASLGVPGSPRHPRWRRPWCVLTTCPVKYPFQSRLMVHCASARVSVTSIPCIAHLSLICDWFSVPLTEPPTRSRLGPAAELLSAGRAVLRPRRLAPASAPSAPSAPSAASADASAAVSSQPGRRGADSPAVRQRSGGRCVAWCR